MATWSYREVWRSAYKAHKKKTGLDEPGMAALLGTTIHSLANYKRDNGSEPPDDFLENAEVVMGLPKFTFRDDPRVKDALDGFPSWIIDTMQAAARNMDGSRLDPLIWKRVVDEAMANGRALEAMAETVKKKS